MQSAEKQAIRYIDKLKRIENLFETTMNTAREYRIKNEATFFIFRNPVLNVKDMSKYLKVTDNTARKHINQLVKLNILSEDDKKRNKTFYFYDLLEMFRS